MGTETAETIIPAWIERVWNQRDVTAIDDLLNEDGVSYGLGEPFHGREPWYEFHAAMCNAFPRMHFDVLGQFTSGDWLCSRIRGDLVHGATDTPVTFEAMIMGRIRDGKFIEAWNSADWLPALTVLGLVEPDVIQHMLGTG